MRTEARAGGRFEVAPAPVLAGIGLCVVVEESSIRAWFRDCNFGSGYFLERPVMVVSVSYFDPLFNLAWLLLSTSLRSRP